ncbi:MAG TPA: hypothetical protein VII06_07865 [Chloroflexota bacterium]
MAFELGELTAPRGHALVYFRAPDDQLYATYVIVPPVNIELGKYLPSMFAAQMPALALPQNAAMPLPPLPEPYESHAALERLARLRHDDLVDAGALAGTGPEQLLYAATEAAQAYAERYQAYVDSAPPALEEQPALPEIDAEDLLLSLMSDRDRLGELAKRTGQLRYAVEGADRAGEAEAVQTMERVGRHLAAKYRVDELIVAARGPGARGQRLADLYLQRAYKLAAEEFDALAALDAAIAAAQAEEP